MSAKKLLDEAMKLKPQDRISLVEILIQSLDEANERLDEIWVQEAKKRLEAYRQGRLGAIPMEEIFNESR